MKYLTEVYFYLFFMLITCNNVFPQKMHSDNGDGTYTNPIIYSDFPDPDVIRVDSTYYMVSTTMFIFPGVTILKSYDMVNWEYCSNAVQRMDFSRCYNLDVCNRYAHGQWATSLKYHNGKYYLLFLTLDEGGFICTATKPDGPWAIRKLPRGFHDPGLFFDDDGKIYVAFGYSNIYVTELELGKVKLGQKAEVSVDAFKDKKFEGKVTYISPEAEFTPKNIQTKDERTKLVFAVKIELPNPDFELKSGMPADAKIFFQ